MLEYMHAYQNLLIQAIYLEGVLIYFECPIYDKKKLSFNYFIQFLSSNLIRTCYKLYLLHTIPRLWHF